MGKPAAALGEPSWVSIDSVFRGSVGKPVFTWVKTQLSGGGAMALLDEKHLAVEAAKRARFRLHHVGTKLNQAEMHELEALAAKRKQTQAELIRGLVLREIEQDKRDLRPSAEMVEITGCRLLLVNLLGPMAKGQSITQEVFDGIVDEVKKQKARVAQDRLKDHEAWR